MSDLRDLRRLEPQFLRAPSAHNAQPWLLDYATDRIELRFDSARELPAGDPTRRDLFLSLGALVEAVLIAATGAGASLEFEPAIDVERRRVGAFVAAAVPYATSFTPDDLERRQTSRLVYAPGRLSSDDLADARAALGSEEALHELPARELVDLYVRADRHLYDSPHVVEELRSWLRLSRRDPRYGQDGLTSECLALSRPAAAAVALLLRPGVYPLVRALRVHRTFTRATRGLLDRDGSVIVLSGPVETLAQVLGHGRSLFRVWLALARRGLYTHPLSQILDCTETERELAAIVAAASPARPFSVFRAGRSEPPARSHRLR